MGYPVLLHLAGRQVVVVGGGQVAARKVADLLNAGANVVVVSPTLTLSLTQLSESDAIIWRRESYTAAALDGLKPFLVIAATDSSSVNAQVISDAQSLGALAGTADDTPGSDFTSMASIHRGPITLAVATDGASPALAAHLRQRLESVIGEEYTIFTDWLSELRPLVKQHVTSIEARRALWEAIITSPALEYIRQGDEIAARSAINRLLAEAGVEEAIR